MTRRSHQMQKYMFHVTCPGKLFVTYVQVPPELEN
jgi:hypothetical protein